MDLETYAIYLATMLVATAVPLFGVHALFVLRRRRGIAAKRETVQQTY